MIICTSFLYDTLICLNADKPNLDINKDCQLMIMCVLPLRTIHFLIIRKKDFYEVFFFYMRVPSSLQTILSFLDPSNGLLLLPFLLSDLLFIYTSELCRFHDTAIVSSCLQYIPCRPGYNTKRHPAPRYLIGKSEVLIREEPHLN